MAVQTLIQIRRGTAAQWVSTNTTLSAGEWGYETDTGRVKVGDGITAWNSLDYAAVTPDSFNEGTGIGLTQGTNGSTLSIAVTGISSSLVTDFESAVSGIVTSISVSTEEIMDIVGTGIVGASGIGVDYQDASNQIAISVTGIESSQINDFNSAVSAILATGALSASEVMDIVGTGIVEGSNVDLTYNAGAGTLTIDVTGVSLVGHTHTSSDITDFDSSVSGLLPITQLSEGTGIGITNVGTDFTISVTGIPSSLVSDFSGAVSNVVDTTLVEGTGISLNYNSGTNELTIATTGVSFVGHTHTLSEVTDVTASAAEVNYLDGSTPGTGVAGKAVVLDSNLSITNIGNITTTGNVTVGGNLTVAGTTTTVNSTVVEIGDNIIRVNTSGLNTGGFEVFDGSNYQQLVYNASNSRWEISTNLYTSGNFIGDLTGNADTVTNGIYSTDTGTVTSTMILDGTIVDADINTSANINVQKLASGSTGQVLQVSATGIIWGGIDGGTP